MREEELTFLLKSDIATSSPWGYIGGMPSQSEFPNNDHIINFLDYYTGLTSPPHYAVLLTGDWGIGKTFFILDYMKKVEEREKKKGKASIFHRALNCLKEKLCRRTKAEKDDFKAIIKVSLNGVQSKDEIDKILRTKLYPIWQHSYSCLIAKTGAGIAKKVIPVDFSKIELSGFFNVYHPETIYVFDDLERCCMPIESILGYINTFVEDVGCKVIIIGNEEEIVGKKQTSLENGGDKTDDITNTQEGKIYKDIKEKIIGHTLKMKSETERALDHFLNQLPQCSAKVYLESQKEHIIDIYRISKLNNLRILQQAINNFQRLYDHIKEKYRENEKFMEDLTALFFPLYLEIKLGNMKCSDLEKIEGDYYANLIAKESKGKSKEFNILKKYSNLFNKMLLKRIFSYETLSHILEDGFISEKKITEELESSSYFHTLEAWEKLKNWEEIEPEKWDSLLKQFEEDFNKRKHKDVEDILHIFGLKIYFSKIKVIEDSLDEVKKACAAYIEEVFFEFTELITDYHTLTDSRDDRFYESSSKEWKELKKNLISKCSKKATEEFKKSIKEKLLSSEGLTQKQIEKLKSEQFKDIALLDLFGVNKICQFLINHPYSECLAIFYTIEDKNHSSDLSTKEKELENVNKIKDHLMQIEKNLNIKEVKNRFKKEKIKYCIEYIDEKIIPVLSGKKIKPDEVVLDPSEVPCQTGNPA